MTRPADPAHTTFIGAAGNRLIADVFGAKRAEIANVLSSQAKIASLQPWRCAWAANMFPLRMC
jgi:hypothetical protein